MYKKICPTAATTTCKKINIYDNPAFTPLPNTEEVPVIDLFYYSTKPCDVYSQIPMYHQPYYRGYPTAGMPLTGMPLTGMPLTGMPLTGMPVSNPYTPSYTAPTANPQPSSYYTGGGCKSCATK